MDYTLAINNPNFTDADLLRLKTAIREIADQCDQLYTETAPNGNVTARQGTIAIYKNGSAYEMWMNTDGATTWIQMTRATDFATAVLLTTDQTIADVKTFTSFPITPSSAPTTNYQTANKKYVDDEINTEMNTSTGHDHDGSDSKKVIATNLDMTGITSGHYLYNNSGTLAGKDGTPAYTADATAVIASASNEQNTVATNYTKVKEITLFGSGTLYFTWQMKVSGETGYARIYRNGVAVGTEKTFGSTSYGTYVTDTVSGWSNGDKIQLYIHGLLGETVYVRYFNIFGTTCTINSD